MTFHLARDLDLPDDATTQTFALLGRRGSGKSYAAGKLAEELLDGGRQVVIVDPVGVWWGLRLAANGHAAGIKIPVFGGWHGDIPLEATAGALMAQLVAERGTSVVLDVSEFTGADQRRFVADFATELLHLKKKNRSPLMTIWDEAQEFVPQYVRPDHARMVGAMEKLVKLGRNFGIGVTLISQRPQAVHKDVLNQTEVLMVFQLTGPQERKVIEGWVTDHSFEKKQVDELPRLPPGTAFIWSPQWLGRFLQAKIAKKRTFDASATPEQGAPAAPSRQLPEVDLEKIRKQMAATIEAAKDNDPKELKAEIHRLRAELAGSLAGGAAEERDRLREATSEADKELQSLHRFIHTLDGVSAEEVRRLRIMESKFDVVMAAVDSYRKGAAEVAPVPSPPAVYVPTPMHASGPRAPSSVTFTPANGKPRTFPNGTLSKCARALLNVLAQRGRASDSQLSALAGYRVTSSTFANGLSELRVAGYMDGPPERREVSQAGRKANGPIEPVPTGARLLDYWRPRLGKCERAMLDAIYKSGSVSRKRLSEITGYRETSSTFANGISALRTLELVHGPNAGDLTIADVFMERG